MPETVLVTGAEGLIGRPVIEALTARGDRVIALDRDRPHFDHPSIVCLAADLRDLPRAHAIMSATRVDAMVHCGAVSGPMVAVDNPFFICETNITGTANLLEAARIHGLRRVVYCSSITAYGPTGEGPIGEDHALRPTSVYGGTKAAGEQILGGYRHQHGVDGVALRIGWVYGPGRRTACVLREAIRAALEGRPALLSGPADFPRQYVHIEDVVRAMLLALDAAELPSLAYNLTGGSFLPLSAIRDALSGVLEGGQVELDQSAPSGDVRQGRLDLSRIRDELGFEPAITLEDGLASYRDWLREHEY